MEEQEDQPSSSGRPAENGGASPTTIAVDLSTVIEHCRCPICMGIVRNTRAVSACMHRFCKDCIEAWLRTQIENNCPQCRVKFASKRDCKPDPSFDQLMGALFGDLERFEQDALEPSPAVLERAREIGQSIAQAKDAATTRRPAPPPPAPRQPAAAEADATVHVTVVSRGGVGLGGAKQLPPQLPQGIKRPAAAAVPGGETKRFKGAGGGVSGSGSSGAPSPPSVGGGAVGLGKPDKYAPANHEFRGVRKAGSANWHAKTKRAHREVLLGTFPTSHEAARCYDIDRLIQQGNKAQRLNFPNLRDTYKQLIAEGDKSAPDFLAKAVAAASAVAKRMGTTALVRTASGRGGSRPRSAIAAARTLLVSGESDDEEEEDEDGDHEDEEEDEDGMLLYGDDEEEEEDERTASLPDSPADRATARSGPGSGAGGSRQQQQPAAAAASPPASGEQAAAQVSSTVLVRQRAAELAAQFPISAAFSCGPAVALVRLEAGLLAGSGGFGWGMRFLAIPAAASMAQVKAVVAAGLAEALGRALPAACVGLVVQNDLDSSADFDALCCEDPGTGNLLLRDQITVRSLLSFLEDCTEDLMLEYHVALVPPNPPLGEQAHVAAKAGGAAAVAMEVDATGAAGWPTTAGVEVAAGAAGPGEEIMRGAALVGGAKAVELEAELIQREGAVGVKAEEEPVAAA